MSKNVHLGRLGVSSKRSGFFAKPTSRRATAIASGGALALGIFMGSGVSGATSSTEIQELAATVTTVQSENDLLSQDVERLKGLNDKARDSELAKGDTIAALKADIVGAKADVETKTAKITELETALAASLAAAAEPLYVEPEPLYIAPPAQEATSAYYKNCTAARNAGAAPVYRGEPGYGSHLDRDGDGVGCE